MGLELTESMYEVPARLEINYTVKKNSSSVFIVMLSKLKLMLTRSGCYDRNSACPSFVGKPRVFIRLGCCPRVDHFAYDLKNAKTTD